MKKKQNRWERIVESLPTDCESGLWKQDVVKLLRAEHRAIVRLVERLRANVNGPGILYDAAYKEACDDLLAVLATRQKGTR